MPSLKQKRFLYILGFACAFIFYPIGIADASIFGNLLALFSLALEFVIVVYVVEDFRTRGEKTDTEDYYLSRKDSRIKKPKFLSRSGSGAAPDVKTHSQPIEVDADLTSSHASGNLPQNRDLLDAAVTRFNEGIPTESKNLLEEANLQSSSDPVIWAVLAVIHASGKDCKKAMIAKQNCLLLDKNHPASILASAFFDYVCIESSEPDNQGEGVVRNLPQSLEVPSDSVMVNIDTYEVPNSAQIWWKEGLRQLKKGEFQLALTMFHAAIIEYQHFPQAWEGVAVVFGQMDNEESENAALIGKAHSENHEEIPEEIWKSVGLTPRSEWLQRLTIYRIVYGSRSNLSVLLGLQGDVVSSLDNP